MSKARDLASAAPAPSTVSATELGYLDGVTSAIQTQINTKQAVVSGVNDTEIGYLDGVTSGIQTQLNAKAPSSTAVTLTGTETLTNKTISSGVLSGTLTAGGSVGTAGQVLSSTGTGVQYITPSSGALVLIASGTVSGSTQLNIDNVFSSTYDFYKVTIELKNTNSNSLSMRWLTSGTPLTASSYYYAWLGYTWNGSTNNRSTAGGDFIDMGTIQNSPQPFDLTFNKNASNELHCTGQWLGYGNSGYFNGGAHSTAQQAFTGIRLYNGGGFLTGRWSVYGYVK